MKRNSKYRNSFLKDEISNVSRTPFFGTSVPRTLAIILTFIKTAGNTNNSNLAPAPVAALIFVAPFLLISPSNLTFLFSLPFFLDYRVTVVVAPPKQRERAGTCCPRRRRSPSERGERAVRAEGLKGARRPWRSRRRRAAGARGVCRLRRPRRRPAE